MALSILDRFCQQLTQIIRTRGAACFSLGVADNRLRPRAVVTLQASDQSEPFGDIDVDGDTPFARAAARALETHEPVTIDRSVAISGVDVTGPVMVVPIMWERDPLEAEEQPVKRPVGLLAMWHKRDADQFDADDVTLATNLSRQAAALLVEEQLEEFDDIQTAFASVPVGLMLADEDDRVVIANAAAGRILQADAPQNSKVQELDYRDQLIELLVEARESDNGQATGSFVALDGEVYSTSAQVTQENQTIVAFTQSPFTTSAEELTGQVAHELRTPLTVIEGNLQTIDVMLDAQMTSEDLDIVNEFVGTALIQSARMFRLIAETLNISRIHAGKEIELDIREFNIIEAVDQIAAELDDRLVRFNVNRETPETLTVEGDRGKIVSILDNFVKNATKYANPGTTISVRVRPRGDEVILEVEDEGIGIPPDAIHRIGKEAGFRTGISKMQAGGIGLGMVYVRRVTEAHGGRMEIESELGKGSIFRSILPIVQPENGQRGPASIDI